MCSSDLRVQQTDPAVLAEMQASEEDVLAEDHRMTSAQRRDGIHLVRGPDLHVRSDYNGMLYRRALRRVIDSACITNTSDAPPPGIGPQ